MDAAKLRAQLVKHEGYRQFPYRDTVGKLTIGVGRNLDDVGISRAEAEVLLDNDIFSREHEIRARFPWFTALDPVRQAVLLNMGFMGVKTLSTFRNTLAMMARGDYDGAAAGMLQSKWASQVGHRAKELSEQMRTGQWRG